MRAEVRPVYPEDLLYTREHEWLRVEDGRGRVGITHYAQEELGDVVYVELPPPGKRVTRGESLGVVESVKSVSDYYAPVTGTVREVNEEVKKHPELVNSDPYGKGWLLVLEIENEEELSSLLRAEDYRRLVE